MKKFSKAAVATSKAEPYLACHPLKVVIITIITIIIITTITTTIIITTIIIIILTTIRCSSSPSLDLSSTRGPSTRPVTV